MLIAARFPPNPQIDPVFAPFFPSPLAPSASGAWGLGKTLVRRPLPLTAAPPRARCGQPRGWAGWELCHTGQSQGGIDGESLPGVDLTAALGCGELVGPQLISPWISRSLRAPVQALLHPSRLRLLVVQAWRPQPSASARTFPGSCWLRWQASFSNIPTGTNTAFFKPPLPVFWSRTAWQTGR